MAEEALVVVAVEIEEEAEVVEALTEEEIAAIEAEGRAALEAATQDLGTGPVPSLSVATPTLPGEMSATSARNPKKIAWEVAAAVVDMATGEIGVGVEDTGEAATETTEASVETEEEVEEDMEAAMIEEEAGEASGAEEIGMTGEEGAVEAEAVEIVVAGVLGETDAAEAEDLAGAGTDVVGVPWEGEVVETGTGLTKPDNKS